MIWYISLTYYSHLDSNQNKDIRSNLLSPLSYMSGARLGEDWVLRSDGGLGCLFPQVGCSPYVPAYRLLNKWSNPMLFYTKLLPCSEEDLEEVVNSQLSFENDLILTCLSLKDRPEAKI
jgi:hypothetical protein